MLALFGNNEWQELREIAACRLLDGGYSCERALNNSPVKGEYTYRRIIQKKTFFTTQVFRSGWLVDFSFGFDFRRTLSLDFWSKILWVSQTVDLENGMFDVNGRGKAELKAKTRSMWRPGVWMKNSKEQSGCCISFVFRWWESCRGSIVCFTHVINSPPSSREENRLALNFRYWGVNDWHFEESSQSYHVEKTMHYVLTVRLGISHCISRYLSRQSKLLKSHASPRWSHWRQLLKLNVLFEHCHVIRSIWLSYRS